MIRSDGSVTPVREIPTQTISTLKYAAFYRGCVRRRLIRVN